MITVFIGENCAGVFTAAVGGGGIAYSRSFKSRNYFKNLFILMIKKMKTTHDKRDLVVRQNFLRGF